MSNDIVGNRIYSNFCTWFCFAYRFFSYCHRHYIAFAWDAGRVCDFCTARNFFSERWASCHVGYTMVAKNARAAKGILMRQCCSLDEQQASPVHSLTSPWTCSCRLYRNTSFYWWRFSREVCMYLEGSWHCILHHAGPVWIDIFCLSSVSSLVYIEYARTYGGLDPHLALRLVNNLHDLLSRVDTPCTSSILMRMAVEQMKERNLGNLRSGMTETLTTALVNY